MDATLFDETSFTAFCSYASAFVAGGLGFGLAFWLVGHTIAKLLDGLGKGV